MRAFFIAMCLLAANGVGDRRARDADAAPVLSKTVKPYRDPFKEVEVARQADKSYEIIHNGGLGDTLKIVSARCRSYSCDNVSGWVEVVDEYGFFGPASFSIEFSANDVESCTLHKCDGKGNGCSYSFSDAGPTCSLAGKVLSCPSVERNAGFYYQCENSEARWRRAFAL